MGSRSADDDAALAAIGQGVRRARVDAGLRQADLAARAGVGANTVSRIETGLSVSTVLLVRVLRELGLLESLIRIFPSEGLSPAEEAAVLAGRRKRMRVRKPASGDDETPWRWGDEK